jgi:TonB family protein
MNNHLWHLMAAGLLLMPMILVAQEQKANSNNPTPSLIASRETDSTASRLANPPLPVNGGQDKTSQQDPKNLLLPYDQQPEVTTKVDPQYPQAAKKDNLQGTVWLKVSIDQTGKVVRATVQKSDAEIFNQPSIDAAMQWHFRPAKKDGKPVASEVAIPFKYKTTGGSDISDYSQPGMTPLLVMVPERGGFRVMRQHPYLIGQSRTRANDWYPESAIRDNFEGIVTLNITVNETGRVEKVFVRGPAREDLDSAAVRLAKTWTFTPGQVNGQPEKATIIVPIAFSLMKPQK